MIKNMGLIAQQFITKVFTKFLYFPPLLSYLFCNFVEKILNKNEI